MRRENRRKRRPAESLLGTTKGKILVMLCRGRHTVGELAGQMGVTDNAVRAQLHRLERDGFAARAGARRGVRRPHVEYELTREARDLFPRAYEPALVHLVDVLTDRLRPGASRGLLLEAGRRLLREHLGEVRGRNPAQRLAAIMNGLNGSSLGIDVREEPGKTVIRSCSCPLASAIAAHPELCALLASLLGELLGADVCESCEKGESARCRFELTA